MAVQCMTCQKVFQHQTSLNRHNKVKHGQIIEIIVSYEPDQFNNKCLEGCNSSFRTINNLREHLTREHQIEFQTEIHTFKTLIEFESWFTLLSFNDNVEYIRRTKSGDNKIQYFFCNRSGKPTTIDRSARKRTAKFIGSHKINGSCTSQIIVKEVDGIWEVTFIKTHYGHVKDPKHISIPREVKNDIATKLSVGVPPKRILDDIRDNIGAAGPSIQRSDLITSQDIFNIKRSYHISSDGWRHKEDVLSVTMWVDEQHTKPDNCVLLYKLPGENHEILDVQDFCLIIMNDIQVYTLQEFGQNVVTIDSTHGLNPYGYELTTLMVLDEYGHGFPTACMFSNRKDTFIVSIFFSQIKMKVGVICPNVFMSDMDNSFYNAWCQIMPIPQHRLFCTWHVDRAWNSNLNKIKVPEKKLWVKFQLQKIKKIVSLETFKQKLEELLEHFRQDDEIKEFGMYFSKNYMNNVKSWAYAYRQECGIHTNMHIESMHKIIKYYYLEGRKVQRLDKGLHAVVRFVRNRIIDRIISNVKGKSTSYIQKIVANHRLAIVHKRFIIKKVTNDEFILTEGSKSFEVIKQKNEICCNMICNFCNICLHIYQCTCAEYYNKITICEHIHYVVINTPQPSTINSAVATTSTNNYMDVVYQNMYENTAIQNEEDNNQMQDIKTSIRNQIIALHDSLPKIDDLNDLSSLQKMSSHLREAGRAIHNTEAPDVIFEPSNKKIKKQM